jgi:hypothetical protein
MIIWRAYLSNLDLNNRRSSDCGWHAGAVRFADNGKLERKIGADQAGEA